MHFLKINFGMQWTCSSGQSMIIIVTFPAKHYQKSQFMNYENIIHHCGSKKIHNLEQFKYQARGGGQKRAKLCLHSFLIVEPHCKFFSRNQHDCQSCWIIYISSDVIFTTDSWIHLMDVVQLYYDLSTSYQLYCTLWKIFYYLQKVCLHGKSTSLQS